MLHKTHREILLVEDSPSDAHLAQRALAESSFRSNVSHARDGVEAMEMLCQEGAHADCPRPDLILLDLNMPVMSGQEVLEEMVKDDALRHFPVVILTTSAAEADVLAMSKLRCSAYVVKPVDFNEFQKAVQSIVDFWFKVATLPTPV